MNFETRKTEIMAEASAENFYGKRKRDSKLEVCENITSALSLNCEPSELVLWLEENKPTPAKKGAALSKLPANTISGSETKKRDELPVIQGKRFIVTAVQNNTALASIWPELEAYAEEENAQIVAMPIKYRRNIYGVTDCERDLYAEAAREHLLENDAWLFGVGGVRLAVEADILPTAKQPVNAARDLNLGEVATVVASPKQQLMTLPSLGNQIIREAWATGAATGFNYLTGRAGAEAEAAHTFGALFIVQNPDGTIKITNLRQGDDGKIGHTSHNEFAAVLGDLHCEKKDPVIWRKTVDMLERLQPELIVVHDILHFETASHHNRNDGKHLMKMSIQGRTVEADLAMVANDLNELAAIAPVYVVESNHNTALDNWLHDTGYNVKRDAVNAKMYHFANYVVIEALEQGIDQTALQTALESEALAATFDSIPELSDNVIFGNMTESEIYAGWDLSQHGHKGNNGSRGNPQQFSKSRLRLVTGHTHSPAINGDVVTVGVTASLNQGYNRGGGSNWQHSHAFVFDNGSVQLENMNPQKIA